MFAIFLGGIILRCNALTSRSFEYDELWTLYNYSSLPFCEIFKQLTIANNHPINSLLIKWCVSLFGNTGIRIPALICGILTIPVVCKIAWILLKNRFAVVLAAVLISFNACLVHFSQTGRGYSIQTFFIALFFLFVLLQKEHSASSLKKRYLFCIGSSISAILSMLTLTTSILIVFPVLCWDLGENILLFKEKKTSVKNLIPELCGWSITGFFVILWYIGNYSAFRQKQGCGIEITSLGQLVSYFARISVAIVPVWIIPLVLLMLIKNRALFMKLIFPVAFMYVSAIIFNAGFKRVYAPLIPFIILGATGGTVYLAEILGPKKKLVHINILIVTLVLSFWSCNIQLKDWHPIDWTKAFNAAYSKGFFPICSGNGSYTVRVNNFPDSLINNYLAISSLNEKTIIANIGEKNINGTLQGSATEITTDKLSPFMNGNTYLYHLKKAEELHNGDIVLIKIGPCQKADAYEFKKRIRDFSLLINCWLNETFKDKDGNPVEAEISTVKINRPEIAAYLKNLEKYSQGHLVTYKLISF